MLSPLKDRFRGCLVGAVVGDALGAVLEGTCWDTVVDPAKVRKVTGPAARRELRKDQLEYTDDTAMARCVAKSLAEHRKFNAADMAERFVQEYFSEPHRGYGGSVTRVFESLQGIAEEDVFLPARRQFDGQGSYGNGAAMRVCPVALFALHDKDLLLTIAKGSALITHAHPNAVNGAILQASAVQFALTTDNRSPLNAPDLVSHLRKVVDQLEPIAAKQSSADFQSQARYVTRNASLDPNLSPFSHRLSSIEQLIAKQTTTTEVAETLGTGVSAIDAVSAAIFAALECRQKSFQEMVEYAISLGGDTDTIATMAGAIGGAFRGMSDIPDGWLESCEGVDTAIELADKLYECHDHEAESTKHVNNV